jgi:type I restriction enzyme S subunit
MKLKPYSEYKDSGVPWLGQIPAHWEFRPLRSVLRQRNEKNNPIKTEQILSLSIARGVTLYSHEGRGGNKRKGDLTAYKIAHAGDIVLNSMNVIVGAVGLSRYTGAISPVYYALFPAIEEVDIKYYDKVFRNPAFQRYLLIYGKRILIKKSNTGKLNTIRMKISPDDLKGTILPIPSKSEQTQIAKFLDWKTTQINKFIRNKRRLIALLKEQKQNIINEAVTRGLDPNVKLKPSGVEWLGDIPEHWEVRRIKTVTRILRGKFSHRPRNDASLYDGVFPFIQTGDVARAGKFIVKYNQTLNEKGFLVSKQFPKGTLTMTIAANIGDVAILDFDACFPDSIVGFVPRKGVFLEFLYYVFTSMKKELLKEAPVNTQGNLNVERIGGMSIPIPDYYTQRALVKNIEELSGQIDQTITRAEGEIELMREYRTHLISDVVTGQVDVRDIEVPDVMEGDLLDLEEDPSEVMEDELEAREEE